MWVVFPLLCLLRKHARTSDLLSTIYQWVSCEDCINLRCMKFVKGSSSINLPVHHWMTDFLTFSIYFFLPLFSVLFLFLQIYLSLSPSLSIHPYYSCFPVYISISILTIHFTSMNSLSLLQYQFLHRKVYNKWLP